MAELLMFSLTNAVIDTQLAHQALQNQTAGALTVFEGWVRNHNEGKAVSALEYQVYEALAQSEGEKILAEAKQKFDVHDVRCIHRFGLLKLGECAVWVGATSSHRGDAFKATRYVIDELKHRLPIWKKEHYVNESPSWVFCRDHHAHVHFGQQDYYARQSQLVSQKLLTEAKVVVVGAGGLGCPVLLSLAAAGVGSITVVDHDVVAISNLHRQPLYGVSSVGEKKVAVAVKKLRDLNPFIAISDLDLRLNASNVDLVIKESDLVIDCTDNFRTKLLLNDACALLGIPWISASIYKHEGSLRTYVPRSAYGCMRCFRPETPDDSLIGNCNESGVIGAEVATLGAMQASEAITFLQKKTNASTFETMLFHAESLTTAKIKNIKDAACKCCLGLQEIDRDSYELAVDEIDENAEIVDMRDKDDSYLERYQNAAKTVVIVCHRGNRSLRLTKHYRSLGYAHFYSLIGGACSL